jgi:hypothetical protein
MTVSTGNGINPHVSSRVSVLSLCGVSNREMLDVIPYGCW